MVRSAKSHQEEEFDDDEELANDSSSQKGGKRGDQKGNMYRSKHSETEQRRRSKINERFQTLRDLIPQNDQKRDKASFLLEVIEYVQFLQEKLHVYEGSYQGWSQEPTKLVPWRNCSGPAESFIDHSQALRNGSGHESNVVSTPAVPTNAQNSLESDLGMAAVYKAMDHSLGLATQALPLDMHIQPNMFDPVGRGGMATQPLPEPVLDAENIASQPKSQLWEGRPYTNECAVPNHILDEQELKIESESVSISSAYSQGILNTLTQALHSSGVDLSQANISVQIDVGKRGNSGLTTVESSSKDLENISFSSHAPAYTRVGNCSEDSNQAHKKLRREKC